MSPALIDFKMNIQRVRDLHDVYLSLSSMVTSAVDLTDLLRSEIVLAVSSLDKYVHSLALDGMVEVYTGSRPQTPSFNRFSISLDLIIKNTGSLSTTAWLRQEIQYQHSFKSFQQSKKLTEAVRLFSDADFWNSCAQNLGQTQQDIRTRLDLIVDRRHKIAHEADADPSVLGQRWPIDEPTTKSAINFMEALCTTIDASVW